MCLFSKRVSGSSYTVENASNAALVPSLPEMKPALAAVGSTTVADLSQLTKCPSPTAAGFEISIFKVGLVQYSSYFNPVQWCPCLEFRLQDSQSIVHMHTAVYNKMTGSYTALMADNDGKTVPRPFESF